MPAIIDQIVSGGQTGADRAALDAAIACGVPHGGWCPRGRVAEDGPIAAKYQLQETESAKYDKRTKQNVLDSDGTLILSMQSQLSGGTALTAYIADWFDKPLLKLHPGVSDPNAALQDFVTTHQIRVLNIAGPRASGEPEVYDWALETLCGWLGAGE